jgi:membrane protein implicated in regulation of membrane protease activity
MAIPNNKKPAEKLKNKADSPVDALIAGIQFLLMVIGIAGVATTIFGDNGVLVHIGRMVSGAESASILIVIPLVFIAIYIARYWFERTFVKSSSAVMGDAAMYTMMVIGAYFLFQYLNSGSFAG